MYIYGNEKGKYVKRSHYRPGVAHRVGRGIALLFHDRGTRRGWVVSSTPRPHFTPGKDPVPILQEAGWAPRPVWTGGKSRPHRDWIPDLPTRSSVAISTELPDPHIYDNTSIKSFENEKCFRQIGDKIKTHILCLINFLRKSYRLWGNLKKIL